MALMMSAAIPRADAARTTLARRKSSSGEGIEALSRRLLGVMIHSARPASMVRTTIDVKIFTAARQVCPGRRFWHAHNYNARFSCHGHDVFRRSERFAE